MLELLIGPITGLLSKVIPDKDQRDKLAHEIATLAEKQAHEQIIAQVKLNTQEAAHKSLFVAGWRPAVGWICALSMGFNFMVVPLGNLGLKLAEQTVFLPTLDLSTMMPVLLGMLGLGGMRSYEKSKGIARER